MAELAMVIGLADGAAGLLIKCGSVVKTLNDLVDKYKKAELTIKTLIQQLEAIKAAWARIKEWSEEYQSYAPTIDSELLDRLDKSLQCGGLVISALEEDLIPYYSEKKAFGLRQRSKSIWNENSLQLHQTRVRDQVLTMTLLLQVLKLPTAQDQVNLLGRFEALVRRSDESALSIVPSRMSFSTDRRCSLMSFESASMVYLPLSFEDDLFTAKVYKRSYRTPLMRSIFQHKVESFQDGPLMQPDPVLELMSNAKPGYKAVHVAAVKRNIAVMETLLALGANVDEQTDIENWAPLHLVAMEGHAPMTRLLLQKGADVQSKNWMHQQPIHCACLNGCLEVVRILLDHGATINCTSRYGYQPLHQAASWRERPDMIEFLVSNGANMHGETGAGLTPLHMACKYDHVLNVRILLTLHVKTGLKLTDDLLDFTVSRASPSAVEELLKHGFNPNFRESILGKTALHRALEEFAMAKEPGKNEGTDERRAWKSIIQTLLKYEANVGAANMFSDQPLHSLVERRKPEADIDDDYKGMIDLLLTSGADMNALNDLRQSPLWLAASHLDYSMVSFLLLRGANHLSESQLESVVTYFEKKPRVWYDPFPRAEAGKMTEFLKQKAAEPIAQPQVLISSLSNQSSDHGVGDTWHLSVLRRVTIVLDWLG